MTTSTIQQLSGLIKDGLQQVVRQYPPERWFERKWIIVLLSAFCGALFIFLTNWLPAWWKKRKLRETMARSLLLEVIMNGAATHKHLPEIERTLADFKRMASTGNYLGYPSIIDLDLTHREFYHFHFKDLGLLDIFLRDKLMFFYGYLKSADRTAKRLDFMFDRFYKKDKTVGSQDILRFGKEFIKQVEALRLLQAELEAGFVVFCGVDEPNPQVFKEAKEKVRSYLKQIEVDEVFGIDDVEEKTGVPILTANVVLLKHKGVKNVKYGQYKKTQPK